MHSEAYFFRVQFSHPRARHFCSVNFSTASWDEGFPRVFSLLRVNPKLRIAFVFVYGLS